MSDQDDASKTEEPSSRRLEDARSRGQVLQSRDVAHLIMLTAALLVVMMISPLMMRDLSLGLRRFIEQPDRVRIDSGNFHALMVDLTSQLAVIMGLPLFLLLLAALATGPIQHGWQWQTHTLQPDLSRLNLLKGFGRLFSGKSVVELLKAIVKIAIISAVGLTLLAPIVDRIDSYITADLSTLMTSLFMLTVRLITGVIGVMVVLALIDYLYQKWQLMKSLRMTKQELKDEFKQMEGDPAIRQRLRNIRSQRARKRMMAAVPTATVVVTNPTHFAIALRYEQPMNAPKVVAKGLDLIALRIIDLARQNFVPVVENPPLARTLYATTELDEEIPREHYKAVAEVIGYVMRLKRQAVH